MVNRMQCVLLIHDMMYDSVLLLGARKRSACFPITVNARYET